VRSCGDKKPLPKNLFVREFVQDGEITIKFVKSEDNDNDLWSKNKSVTVLEKQTNKFMVDHEEKSPEPK